MGRLQLTPDAPYVDGDMKAHIESLDPVTALVETDERYAGYRANPSSLTADAMYEIERSEYGASDYRNAIEFLGYVPLTAVNSMVEFDPNTKELTVVPGGDVARGFDKYNSFPLADAPPLSIYFVGNLREIVRQHFLVRLPGTEHKFLAFKSMQNAEAFVQMQKVRHDVHAFADFVFWRNPTVDAREFLTYRVLMARPELDPEVTDQWLEARSVVNGYLFGRYHEGRIGDGWLLGDTRYFYPADEPGRVNAYVRRAARSEESRVLNWVREASLRTDLQVSVVQTLQPGAPYLARLVIFAPN